MKVKIKVGTLSTYVGVIEPLSGEHKKSVFVSQGEEIELLLPTVHGAGGIEIGSVIGSVVDSEPNEAERVPEEPQADDPHEAGGSAEGPRHAGPDGGTDIA